jgi:hypothetical protein
MLEVEERTDTIGASGELGCVKSGIRPPSYDFQGLHGNCLEWRILILQNSWVSNILLLRETGRCFNCAIVQYTELTVPNCIYENPFHMNLQQ